jgi:hypothetical protein
LAPLAGGYRGSLAGSGLYSKLEKIIGEILEEKIEEKFLDAESTCVRQQHKARYFFRYAQRNSAGCGEKED